MNFFENRLLPYLVTFLVVFIPLYPKWPLFGVTHTWVYIRVEDLLIACAVFIWGVLFVKRRIRLPKTIALPVLIYWLVGLISTFIALVFIFPNLANVFPNVAVFHYLRRIEYLILLFVAASTVKKSGDLKKYVIAVVIALVGVIIYGLGQKYLGFPAYLTMNEEFAKGIPLRLPPDARITSTFGGHYDLAAYLVLTIALIGSLVFGVKNKIIKIAFFALAASGLLVLLLTASRVSFAVYLVTITVMLVMQKKKIWIIPVILFSIFMLMQVKGTFDRFAKTIRVQSVVINAKTGQPIAIAELPPELGGQKPKPTPTQDMLPLGTGFLALPPVSDTSTEATSVATIRRHTSSSLKLATGSSEISTISGSFLIQKAFVYDISFTTRLQGGWPRAWNAFVRNPITGSGYSSIDLASDNDYIRLLGETGILGFLSFLLIFVSYFIIVYRKLKNVTSPLGRSFVIGVSAGLVGLFLNAILIDVFEASKVAYIMWMFIGLSVGIVSLDSKIKIDLWQEVKKITTSYAAVFIYLFLIALFVYQGIFNLYFVGDDFTWLRWAATSKVSDILKYFYDAQGFFYRPLPKILYFLTYSVFWLKPFGYHFVSLFIYFVISCLVYLFGKYVFNDKFKAFLAAVIFLFIPINTESVLWVSSYSGMLMVLFTMLSLLFFIRYRREKNALFFLGTVIFLILGLLSHEGAVIIPVLLLWWDQCHCERSEAIPSDFRLLRRFAPRNDTIFEFILLFLLIPLYLIVRVKAGAHGLSGDYNYNLIYLPFNFAGNLFSYIVIALGGSPFIPYLLNLRMFMRQDKFMALIMSAVIIIAGLIIIKLIRKFIRKDFVMLEGFMIISLLPFLGLGNIAERYALLASVFLSVKIVYVLNSILRLKPMLLIGSVVLISYYFNQVSISRTDWEKAGNVSRKVVYAVKDNYKYFPPDSNLYFVNVPLRVNRAWVYPVGLNDAIWFVYRDESIKVNRNNDVESAINLADQNPNSYVFSYDKDELEEVFFK